jgi:hypothetical protein
VESDLKFTTSGRAAEGVLDFYKQAIPASAVARAIAFAFGPFMVNGSAPELVAELVHSAVTDASGRLRYAAGEDAKQILAQRRSASDDSFFQSIRAQFGIGRA